MSGKEGGVSRAVGKEQTYRNLRVDGNLCWTVFFYELLSILHGYSIPFLFVSKPITEGPTMAKDVAVIG